MRVLRNGTVIPSHLSTQRTGVVQDTGNQTNLSLRVGEVVGLRPADADNKFNRYDVSVQTKNGRGPSITRLYKNCVLANAFGGAADREIFSLRVRTKVTNTQDDSGDGALVLLLCVNGETTNAVILGGLRDPYMDAGDVGSSGSFYKQVFNGLSYAINSDGELVLTFTGKTQADGSLDPNADPQASGSTFSMSKDGSLALRSPDLLSSLTLDATNRVVNLQGDEGLNLGSSGNVQLLSAGVLTGAASDATMMGSTYVGAEAELLTSVVAQLTAISALLTTVAASLTASVDPGAAAAGGQLNAMGPMVDGIVASVNAFVAQVPAFTSTKNFSD
jgi:hypothetical protein